METIITRTSSSTVYMLSAPVTILSSLASYIEARRTNSDVVGWSFDIVRQDITTEMYSIRKKEFLEKFATFQRFCNCIFQLFAEVFFLLP